MLAVTTMLASVKASGLYSRDRRWQIKLGRSVGVLGLHLSNLPCFLVRASQAGMETVYFGVQPSLRILHNANFGRSNNSAVEFEAFALCKEDLAIRFAFLCHKESSFVLVGVELLALSLGWIKSF